MKSRVNSLLILLFLLVGSIAQAQTRVPHVGVLVQEMGRAQSQALKGVSTELTQLGYRDRKNIFLETHNAKGDRSALQAAAKELAEKKVEVIFTTGTRATLAAINATQDVPVVFVHPGDPVAVGLLKSSGDAPRNLT
ncbi:MAG TPA: ABC transporter substrate binding protein, partial [Candidatus Binatus sp.]|nr:ABC transporter substrate binding protein [Candidatus Binatus sp.]